MALLYYICIWVLGALGFALPLIIGVIFVLVCILILYQLFWPFLGGFNWWGRRPPGP